MNRQMNDLVATIVKACLNDNRAVAILQGLVTVGGTIYFTAAEPQTMAIKASVQGDGVKIGLIRRQGIDECPITLNEWEARAQERVAQVLGDMQ